MKKSTRNLVIGYAITVAFVIALASALRESPDNAATSNEDSAATSVPENTSDHRADREKRASRVQRPGQKHPLETPPEVAAADPAEADERPIYTMQDFPDEPGIHRVLVDGEVLELAVDHPEDIEPTTQEVVGH